LGVNAIIFKIPFIEPISVRLLGLNPCVGQLLQTQFVALYSGQIQNKAAAISMACDNI
jgi:hypothetical protein